MEIPNYDSDNYKNKKFKQLHPFMPHDTFRMLICGNSGSDKTNLLYHMLIKPLLHYDEIYLYAKNLDQEKYQKLMNKMNEISRNVGYDIMTVSNDKIIPIGDMDYDDNKKLLYSMIMFVKKIRDKLLIFLFKVGIKIVLLYI